METGEKTVIQLILEGGRIKDSFLHLSWTISESIFYFFASKNSLTSSEIGRQTNHKTPLT